MGLEFGLVDEYVLSVVTAVEDGPASRFVILLVLALLQVAFKRCWHLVAWVERTLCGEFVEAAHLK